jgi:methionine-rich copper-binding protein CopC
MTAPSIITTDTSGATTLPTPISHWRLPGFLLLVLTVCALLLLGTAVPASAHDELASSSPQDGTAVDSAPTEVVLTFTNTPSGIGAEVIITDTAGTTWSDGPVSVINNTAVQALKPGAPAGTYTAQWRVVSADDHPIEGTLTFTSTAAAAPTDVGASATEPNPQISEQTSQGATAEAAPETAPSGQDAAGESSGLPSFVLYLLIGGVLVALVLMLITRRNLRSK